MQLIKINIATEEKYVWFSSGRRCCSWHRRLLRYVFFFSFGHYGVMYPVSRRILLYNATNSSYIHKKLSIISILIGALSRYQAGKVAADFIATDPKRFGKLTGWVRANFVYQIPSLRCAS